MNAMPTARTILPSILAAIRAWMAAPLSGTARTGRRGEAIAAGYLADAGYRVLARNVRLPFGEADIVCEAPDGVTIVVVEVKTRVRRAGAPGASNAIPPEAGVGPRKKRKLRALARALRGANRWESRPMRIDTIGVELRHGAPPDIRHVQGVA